MKTIIKNIFSKTYNFLIAAFLLFSIWMIETLFIKRALNINILGEVFQTIRRISLAFISSSVWSITISYLLISVNRTKKFANKHFDVIIKTTFGIAFAMHLPFALGIELFSLFATLITLPLSSQLFESIKHLFKFSREENVVVCQKKRNAPKFKHKQRKKPF
ncbi:hypothetical protein QM894_03630 [Streptococcus cristatus]|uniref:hypothetical protein n=1 Tax=Streptococcus cristatus TaxID=45634 RepID=UPI0039C14233